MSHELPALTAAVVRVESDANGALPALRAMRSPLAHVWAAYAANQTHDAAAYGAEEALLTEVGLHADPPEGRQTPELSGLLLSLRTLLERASLEEQTEAQLVPCWLFARHGREALPVFSAIHGSILDTFARQHKDRCLDARIQSALTMPQQQALRAAREGLTAAMFRVVPRPQQEEGTMWASNVIEATDELVDVVLAPQDVPLRGTDAELAQLVARAPRRLGRLAPRVAAYGRQRDAALPGISAGICASAHTLGRELTVAACTERARAASNAMLRSWLDAHVQD